VEITLQRGPIEGSRVQLAGYATILRIPIVIVYDRGETYWRISSAIRDRPIAVYAARSDGAWFFERIEKGD
jgi:hypothetical protein